MPHSPDETLAEIRRTLARWQTTHPEATFAEMEEAVEDQLHRLRASLLDEQAGETIVREQPACQQCGERMTPRATARRPARPARPSATRPHTTPPPRPLRRQGSGPSGSKGC